MAHSISKAKIISSFILHQYSAAARRGYASALQGGVSETVRGSVVSMMKKGSEESTKSSAWVPDPVTGHYKPEGHGNQVDAAELRALLFKQKTRRE